MIQTQRYLRKPLYVDAVRVTKANFEEIAEWCQGEILFDEVAGERSKDYIKVRVQLPKNPRQTKAFVGDWILYTDRGYKVYTNKAFRMAFDPVPPKDAPVSDGRLSGDPVADGHIEVVQATPESIARAVSENEAARAGNGKRILSVEEQNKMPADELKALIQTGEVALEQDVISS